MDEYISREAVVERIKSCIFTANDAWESGYNTAMAEIMEWIKHIPSADVQPVKHGRWIEVRKHRDEDGYIETDYKCSECGIMLRDTTPEDKDNEFYCYHCGARMDGDDE